VRFGFQNFTDVLGFTLFDFSLFRYPPGRHLLGLYVSILNMFIDFIPSGSLISRLVCNAFCIATVGLHHGRFIFFLAGICCSPITGQFIGQNIRLGSRGDSYYEYLVKVWLQQGGADDEVQSDVTYLRDIYEEAMAGVEKLLVRKSKPKGLVYVGELPNGIDGNFSPKMDHLV
jgi:hypothetical protein